MQMWWRVSPEWKCEIKLDEGVQWPQNDLQEGILHEQELSCTHLLNNTFSA